MRIKEMADTTFVNVSAGAWGSVATAVKGFITNEGSVPIKFREAASDPGAGTNDGHTLPVGPGESVNFDLAAGQNLFVRAIGVDGGRVAVTTE